ncbi:acyltransferase domain-containing protein [Streptomyces sp. RKCA744]|uniref:acyltransferase domain-containing protein n=1 Tax=Streptomyces sp. RKCA744 TaxID=2959340 RepID=UPI00209ED432|nr:acyltransferase domain-containing protein [Streptomyces sp. RKCA744]MCO8308816.1 acyltransferase domain-containing protein [Streptomyces sp. RKCA744]
MNAHTTSGPVLLFSGQGGYDGPALMSAHRLYPQVRAVFQEIDTVTVELFSYRISERLLSGESATLADLLDDEPWLSQLAIYGAGLAAYRVLTDHGVSPSVLVGHSLGEITALVAAGAYSIADGARIVARRTKIIAEHPAAAGAMVALAADPVRTAHVLGVVGSPSLAIATENHDAQTVVSGPRQEIEDVEAIAGCARIGCVRLGAPFAFHHPALAPVAPDFAKYVMGLARQPLTVPVYSPILRRFYETDEPLADPLADHLSSPVRFSTAIRMLYGLGHRVFVESGGRAALSSVVRRVLPDADREELTTLSTLHIGSGDQLRLSSALESLAEAGLATGRDARGALRLSLAPQATEAEFDAFWAASGRDIIDQVTERLHAFRADRAAAAPAVMEAPAEAVAGDPVGPGGGGAVVPSRDELFAAVRSLYAEALEYPEEVFTPEALLEAELGVDSVKQVELMSRVTRLYGLSQPSSEFRLTEYETLGRIVDLVEGELAGHRFEGAAA